MLEIPIIRLPEAVTRLPDVLVSTPILKPVQSDSERQYPHLQSASAPNLVHAIDAGHYIQQFIEAPVMESNVRLVKLARSGMRSHAARLLKEQDGLCPLCSKPIDLKIKGEGVIDHDHDTGRIRGLLHRSCNAAEGKISNAAARWGAKSSSYEDIIPYLERVVTYLKKPASTMVYPMHKTPDEKRDARLLKAREQRAAVAAKRKLAQANRRTK